MGHRSFLELEQQVMAHAGARERVAALRHEMLVGVALHELRQRAGLSQNEIAEALGKTQSAVSRFEHGDDPRLSTLSEYVKAIGGSLEVLVRFDDEEIKIAVSDDDDS